MRSDRDNSAGDAGRKLQADCERMKARSISLAIVRPEELGRRSFAAPNGTLEPYYTGTEREQPDLVCGSCGFVLVTRLPMGLIAGLIFQCPVCLALNEARQ